MISEINSNILLFDGVCNLCTWTVQFIIKKDHQKKFKFASLQSHMGQLLLRKFGLASEEFHSLVLVKGDQYYLKSTAVLKVLTEIGGLWKVLYIFILIPSPIRDLIYAMIAKSRYRLFGKRETCMVPEPGIRERFL